MEDKELKKKLRKVPDVDSSGEPIWKIEGSASERDGKAKDRDARPSLVGTPSGSSEKK